MRILNWQAYIDPSEDGAVGTLDRFTEATGIAVTYDEDFNDNNEVYNRLLAPVLGTGGVIDYDIICPTNWMAARLQERSAGSSRCRSTASPTGSTSRTGSSTRTGTTGRRSTCRGRPGSPASPTTRRSPGRELRSINDLFDPEFRGRVAMLTEMRDTLGLVDARPRARPDRVVDEEGAFEALDMIEQATDDGQIRAFTGNEYLRSLESGDFVACIAWSGDIVQLQYDRPDIQFVIPEEGGMSWYDTMVIPKGAPNAFAAADWMNFVYDPVQAAQLTAWVQFISPVKGVRDELIKMGGDAAALADSPILFPTPRRPARLSVFADLPDEIDVAITERFLVDHGRLTDGRRHHHRRPHVARRAEDPVRADPARDAVHVRVLHRPADHAAQDLAVDEARPPAARTTSSRGSGATSPTAFDDFGDAAGAVVRLRRHRHRAVPADRLPGRLLHRLQGRAAIATCCSGW